MTELEHDIDIKEDNSKQLTKNEILDTQMIDFETNIITNDTLIPTKEQNFTDFSTEMSQLNQTKPNLSNRKKLTGFVSSIFENVKHAWIKAKNDYHESLKRHNKRLYNKKYPYSLHQQKATTKIRKRTPLPKTELNLSMEKVMQEVVSNASTHSTAFQSCIEWLPNDISKIRKLSAPLKDMDKENLENPLITSNLINQKMETIKAKSSEQEALCCVMTSLKEQLEETKKRLEMFEKKYGLYDDIFINIINQEENSEIHNSSLELKNNTITDHQSYPLLSLPSNSSQLINNSYISDSIKTHEQVFNEDPSLETLSPVILQNNLQ
ncbi:hypothetical protein PCANB_000551 [Pneumocystis canis]|nr:hypothetical protein PCANB_000551 [Pneumocystis canis]